jgi:hypothetical protein
MHHRRSFRIKDYNDLDSEEEIADGYGIKVPLMMADAAESRTPLADAYSGRNKPGPCADALESMQRDGRTTVSDAVAADTLDRLGYTLEDLQRLRDAAHADQYKREQWKPKHLARDSNGDYDEPDRPSGPPDYTDPAAVEAARETTERVRLEEGRRGDLAWRNMGRLDPTVADRIQRRGMAWRNE